MASSVPPSTHVAYLSTVNLLLSSIGSTDSYFGSIDLTDFYLGTSLSTPQFIKIYTHLFSDYVLSHLSLRTLASHGFFETTTSCLFRHVSRPVTFVLVIDDFGVKYHHLSDFQYRVSCLSSLYQISLQSPTRLFQISWLCVYSSSSPSPLIKISPSYWSRAPVPHWV